MGKLIVELEAAAARSFARIPCATRRGSPLTAFARWMVLSYALARSKLRGWADRPDAFRTLAACLTAELEERGSRFLAIGPSP